MCQDHNFGISSKRILEQIGELGVTPGDVGLLEGQSVEDVYQSRQRLVDVDGFVLAVSLRQRLFDVLATGQIDHVQASR